MIGVMIIDRHSESGSVIYWIFIAIALFAALSFTVSRINRSGNTQIGELTTMQATDIMQYSAAIQRGVRVMRVNGVDDGDICFHTDQWGHADYEFTPECDDFTNRVFAREGGGIGFQEGVADWYDRTLTLPAGNAAWVFTGAYEIGQVGTDGAGPGTTAANADLIMVTAPVMDELCEGLNRMIGYTDDPAPPVVADGTYAALAGAEFAGTFGGGAARLGNLGRERCVAEDDGSGGIAHYIYYKVILAR